MSAADRVLHESAGLVVIHGPCWPHPAVPRDPKDPTFKNLRCRACGAQLGCRFRTNVTTSGKAIVRVSTDGAWQWAPYPFAYGIEDYRTEGLDLEILKWGPQEDETEDEAHDAAWLGIRELFAAPRSAAGDARLLAWLVLAVMTRGAVRAVRARSMALVIEEIADANLLRMMSGNSVRPPRERTTGATGTRKMRQLLRDARGDADATADVRVFCRHQLAMRALLHWLWVREDAT